VSDMATSLADCRVWFSADGYGQWGSPETKTGTVNCYFTVPVKGLYRCTASLQSSPATTQATVDCSIDGSSFGALPFTGTRHQPHFSQLEPGGHAFRIRQLSGSWYFLSLKVQRFWIPTVTED
jgi:hypothetical protein